MSKILKFISVLIVAVLLVSLLVYSRRVYLKNAYPIKYGEYVEKYCEEYNLDPYFVFAVIRTESNFTPNVHSSVDARGLMQVTKETFDWISLRLGDKESTFDDMYDPETSVKYGVYLLSYLKEQLGSNQNILCGYHAGVNITKDWLSDEERSKNGEIIVSKIPYGDTKNYVEKVTKTYNMYVKLYK